MCHIFILVLHVMELTKWVICVNFKLVKPCLRVLYYNHHKCQHIWFVRRNFLLKHDIILFYLYYVYIGPTFGVLQTRRQTSEPLFSSVLDVQRRYDNIIVNAVVQRGKNGKGVNGIFKTGKVLLFAYRTYHLLWWKMLSVT